MTLVLTLIASPESRDLTAEVVETARGTLESSGLTPGTADWLAPNEACDIGLSLPNQRSQDLDRLRQRLEEFFADRPFDVGLQTVKNRRKRLLLADMDATIVTGETLDELADEVGLKDQIAAVTGRAMAGELDFADALRARLALLADLPVEALGRTLARTELTAGAGVLVQTMKRHGAYSVLVSGGFSHFTDAIGARVGFDEAHGNRLEIADGRLTGGVTEPILGRQAKLRFLERTAARLGLGHEDVCSVGDGANDGEMLAAAGLGVAYRGKAPAREAATVSIDHGDLTALLYLQGYRREEFAL